MSLSQILSKESKTSSALLSRQSEIFSTILFLNQLQYHHDHKAARTLAIEKIKVVIDKYAQEGARTTTSKLN